MFYYIYVLSLFSNIFFYFYLFPGILEFWCLVTVTFKFIVLYNNIYRKKKEINGSLLLGDRWFLFWKCVPSISIWQQPNISWSFLWQFDYSYYSIRGRQRLWCFFLILNQQILRANTVHIQHINDPKRFQNPFTCRKSKISWSLSHNKLFRQWHQSI